MRRQFPEVNICEKSLGQVSASRLAALLEPLEFKQNEFLPASMEFWRASHRNGLFQVIWITDGGTQSEFLTAQSRISVANYRPARRFIRFSRIEELDRNFRWGWDKITSIEQAMNWECIVAEQAPLIVGRLDQDQGDALLENCRDTIELSGAYFQKLLEFAESDIPYDIYFPAHYREIAKRYTRGWGVCSVLDLRRITDVAICIMLTHSNQIEGRTFENIKPVDDEQFKERLSIIMSDLFFRNDQRCARLVNQYYESEPEISG